MKTQINILALAIAVVLGTTSCKKDADNPTPAPAPSTPTKTDIITAAKGWKMVSLTVNNLQVPLEECEKDDISFFKTNKTYTFDQGATKCDPNDNQTENGTWQFINNESQLVLDGADTFKIVKLTVDTIKVESTINEDGMTYTQSATFVGVK